MPQTSTRRPSRGFTLLELLMVVAVGAIVLGLGIPSFMDLIARNRMTTQVNELIANLQLARSEAIKRRVEIVLCPSTGDDEDNLVCAEQTSWDTGYIIFPDRNDNRDRDPASEELLRVVEGSADAAVTITGNHNGNHITYDAEGASRGNAGTFTLCDTSNSADPRAVIISPVGRPYTSSTKPDGGALECD
jgi:type IV fimbrial biogenesis protein FimT